MKLPLYIYVTAAYAFVFSAKLRVNVDDTAGAYYAEFGTGDLSRESIAHSYIIVVCPLFQWTDALYGISLTYFISSLSHIIQSGFYNLTLRIYQS